MKIERHSFEGADPNPRRELLADGTPSFNWFAGGPLEIFIPIDGGPNGHVITLSREEAGSLE